LRSSGPELALELAVPPARWLALLSCTIPTPQGSQRRPVNRMGFVTA
jgi:hypothetical protein